MKKIAILIVLIVTVSCEAIFVDDISDDVVVIIAPSNNTNLDAGDILFTWSAVTDATNYKLQIAVPGFENASQILVDSLTTETSVSVDLTAGEYQWRVKAMNSDYETEYSTVSFSVN